jgi:hypothetical protein
MEHPTGDDDEQHDLVDLDDRQPIRAERGDR